MALDAWLAAGPLRLRACEDLDTVDGALWHLVLRAHDSAEGRPLPAGGPLRLTVASAAGAGEVHLGWRALPRGRRWRCTTGAASFVFEEEVVRLAARRLRAAGLRDGDPGVPTLHSTAVFECVLASAPGLAELAHGPTPGGEAAHRRLRAEAAALGLDGAVPGLEDAHEHLVAAGAHRGAAWLAAATTRRAYLRSPWRRRQAVAPRLSVDWFRLGERFDPDVVVDERVLSVERAVDRAALRRPAGIVDVEVAGATRPVRWRWEDGGPAAVGFVDRCAVPRLPLATGSLPWS